MAESIKVKLRLYLWRQGEYRAISPYMAGFSLYSILWHVILILCHFTFWPHRMACGILVPCHCCSVAQSCPTLCDPMNCSMPGLPVHHQLPELAQTHVHRVGDAIQPSHPLSPPSPPALNLSWCQDGLCMLSHVQPSATLWTVTHQAPLSTEFSRQEYWGGLPLPTPRDFPDPRIKPHLLDLLHCQADSLPLCHLGSST